MLLQLPEILNMVDYTVPYLRTSVIYRDVNRNTHIPLPPKHTFSENPLKRNDAVNLMVATANNILKNGNVEIEGIKSTYNGSQQCLQINLARNLYNAL